MSVDFKKSEYKEHLVYWNLVRDVIDNNVYQKKYIPPLSGQSLSDYEAYVNRASLFNATDRTRGAILGLIFAKSPQINTKLDDFILDDFDLHKSNYIEFIKCVCNEVLITGRAGVLVDYPKVDEVINKQQKQEKGIHTYSSLYSAEDIINWRVENNKLSLVVLKENYLVTKDFAEEIKTRYRVLRLENGIYKQEIYEDDLNNPKEPIEVKVNNKPLDFIPFIFFSSVDNKVGIKKSPLLDIAQMNLSHFKTNVDIEHCAHFSALPTPYILSSNINPDTTFKIGSQTFLCIPESDAKIGFLEFSGSGISALMDIAKNKQDQMAILGAKMLFSEKKLVESAEALSIRSSDEKATLNSITNALSNGFSNVLKIMSYFEGNDDKDAFFKINENYINKEINPTLLSEVIAGIQAGLMPNSTLYLLLNNANLLSEDIKSYKDFELAVQSSLGITRDEWNTKLFRCN